MKIEWDPNKARTNLRKHKVSFEEASTALYDTMSVTGPDPDHSVGEFRYVTFGMSAMGRVIVISHTDAGDIIRIISARVASKGERKLYEEE